MSGRALLNLVEADMLDGLNAESRAQMLWSIHDPAGFVTHADEQQNEAKKAALLGAGGEIG